MDETAQSPNDAKTLKKLEITDSTVLTGDIIGARGGYSSVEEVVIHDSSIRLNDEYTYNYCTIGGGTNGSFGSIDIQNSQIHIPSSGGNTAIGNGWQVYYNRESRIRIANSEVSVRCASLGPAIGAAWDSGGGRINIIIENSTVTAKGGNLRTDGNYVPGIGKNALGRAPEIGIQILNSTVDSFRLTEKGGTDYVYDDLHTQELPGIPAENISICGSTVNGTRIDHSFDEYGKCAICDKYDLGYCYEHGLLTMDGLTDCVSDGSEKKLTGLSHQTGENETKQLAENTDYTASYSNNVHPYTLTPDDVGFDSEKAPKVTLYGTGNYCGKAEHYFTISENTAAAPTITTDTLPNGKVGEAYSQTLTADGTTPITWGISGSALPKGLTLNETTGEISGTPTAEGTASFTVKATNSAGSDTKELSITITKDAPPAHEHSYGDWSKDGTSHWHECTDTDCPNREESITDKAAHVYTDDADTTCDVCGYKRTVTPPAHEHSYGDWRKDGTSHWHECTDTDCPNREESIKDKATHVYTDDADTTCDVCGYERTVTPPAHEHSYGDWSKDGTSHWHECTDDDCPNREESIKDKAAHVYTDDADTTCNVCSYERTVTPPAHEHSYGDWRKDGTSHWHECADADCPNRNESIKDKAAHVYTDDADTTCDVCGYERTVTPPAPTEFIVTFDGNGGTPSVGSMTTTNQKLTSLPSASRSGSYSFDGWYTDKSGGTKITTDTVFSANTTVYAHWTYIGGGGGYNPPVTYYTLRFETGGGSDIPSVREAYNTYIDLTKYVPTWRGHTFIGWYSERSLTNKVSGVYLTKDMTVYAGWRVDENPNTGANPFTDVSEKDWFYGDVMFVYENGLMLGTSKTLFSPHGTATRGMMATILWRMEGSPAPKGKNSFTDVEAGKWYADAITWTAENGIFAGYGKDKFGPDDPITREQLAAIFYRYADYKGYDLTVKGNLDKFKDADKITDYAKTAMQWAVGSGLVKGKSGNLLDPQGTATRAEIAAMLHRFIEKYELVQGKAPGGLMGWIDPKRLQIPKTGDSSVLGLWGFSLCISLAGCLALTTWQIRRWREEEALQIIEK
ncbi:MAG: S-layer homology domain-containing protein [Oscillospiraceae bacterium]